MFLPKLEFQIYQMDVHIHAMREYENTFVLHNQNHVDSHEELLAHQKDNFLVDLAH